jgi:hypothetical protein
MCWQGMSTGGPCVMGCVYMGGAQNDKMQAFLCTWEAHNSVTTDRGIRHVPPNVVYDGSVPVCR